MMRHGSNVRDAVEVGSTKFSLVEVQEPGNLGRALANLVESSNGKGAGAQQSCLKHLEAERRGQDRVKSSYDGVLVGLTTIFGADRTRQLVGGTEANSSSWTCTPRLDHVGKLAFAN